MFFDKSYIGKKFKEYRKNIGYTQECLSEKIGIAEKHYGKLERGEFMPSLETFFSIIDELRIPISEFGFNAENITDKNREYLIKEIYLASDKELLLYRDLINSVKKYAKK